MEIEECERKEYSWKLTDLLSEKEREAKNAAQQKEKTAEEGEDYSQVGQHECVKNLFITNNTPDSYLVIIKSIPKPSDSMLKYNSHRFQGSFCNVVEPGVANVFMRVCKYVREMDWNEEEITANAVIYSSALNRSSFPTININLCDDFDIDVINFFCRR